MQPGQDGGVESGQGRQQGPGAPPRAAKTPALSETRLTNRISRIIQSRRVAIPVRITGPPHALANESWRRISQNSHAHSPAISAAVSP